MRNNCVFQSQSIPAYALKEIRCINCGKLGHISCNSDLSDRDKQVDWGITEAIERGFYSFISNYDSWQEFRKRHEKNKPVDPPVVSNDPKPPAADKNEQKTEPANDFMSLMLLDMD